MTKWYQKLISSDLAERLTLSIQSSEIIVAKTLKTLKQEPYILSIIKDNCIQYF